MDFTKTHAVLLIVTVSLLFAPTSYAARTTEARIWNMCKPTTNPVVCYKTILPEATKTQKFNMYKALEVEIQAAQTQVIQTATNIATLIFQSSNNKDVSDALNTCKDQFSNIVDAITESVDLVSKRNVGEARFKFSAVISYYSACKDAFTESNITFPIAADAQAVYDLGGNCLDLMKAIEDKERARRT
ncbi:uncharacterized protein [Cicer arietinum]|uniref:Uncharacterized protein LOC101505049 n=1 Tax=Cicer arietinum TaxID=3827 RepID=A0A1S2XDE9_CICAR|nr:uncharacterized protein LOC101505049 [Cicer arietinum]